MNIRVPLVVTITGLLAGCGSMPGGVDDGSSGEFADVTAAAGIKTEGARSAGWADYNNDGCIDFMVTQATGAKLYRNDCDGGFTDVSLTSGIAGPVGGFGVAWADYDDDGDLDVYVASADGANILYRNNGNGRFQDVAAAAGVDDPRASTTAAWRDMDGDGDLDLFVANRFYPKPESDITDRLYRNNGDGTFTDVGVQTAVAVKDRKTFAGAWLDFDNNGTQDLYLAVDFGDDQLYSNYGDGRFFNVAPAAGITGPAHSMGLAVGDINSDGCTDVISTNNTRGKPGNAEHGPTTLYLNNCNSTFSNVTAAWGIEDRGTVDWGVNMVDWDNDGDLDLSIVSGGMLKEGEKETNVLYENRAGRLVNVTADRMAVVDGAAFGSAWADYDNDGDLDWLIVNSKKNSVLLENRAADGHYIVVVLKGDSGNRNAVGAVVEVTANGKRQYQTIQAGKGYGSSEALEAHFGLGKGDRVEQLKVTWPGGGETRLQGLKADQRVTIKQS